MQRNKLLVEIEGRKEDSIIPYTREKLTSCPSKTIPKPNKMCNVLQLKDKRPGSIQGQNSHLQNLTAIHNHTGSRKKISSKGSWSRWFNRVYHSQPITWTHRLLFSKAGAHTCSISLGSPESSGSLLLTVRILSAVRHVLCNSQLVECITKKPNM